LIVVRNLHFKPDNNGNTFCLYKKIVVNSWTADSEKYCYCFSKKYFKPVYFIYFCAYMSTKAKSPKDSFTIMNELVLPNDTNTLNNLMGGRLLHWMDIAAAISAQKHCNRIVVTASVDNVSFKQAIKLGDVITIEAKVTRSFNTSVEVRLDVWAENIPSGTRAKSNEAYYTFVAVDQSGRTIPVPELKPETEDEIELFNGALRRRQLRLILGGKMQPDDASELKALFFKD
jgi:acyl-CoA hydrolase